MSSITSKQLNTFISFMKWEYEFKGFIGNIVEEQVFHLIQEIKDKEVIFRFLLVVCYITNMNELIIPYSKGVTKLLGVTSLDEVKDYLEKEMVETIHSTEPSLETVFMELTGRSFE